MHLSRYVAITVSIIGLVLLTSLAMAHHRPDHAGGPPQSRVPTPTPVADDSDHSHDDGEVDDDHAHDDGTADDDHSNDDGHGHDPAPEDPIDPVEPAGSDPTLLSSYVIDRGSYNRFRYRPRQFVEGFVHENANPQRTVTDAGVYSGWDVLEPDALGVIQVWNSPSWLTIELNRPADVAIVWQNSDEPPAWLRAWPESQDRVSLNGVAYRVFRQVLPAGEHTLGAVWDTPDLGSGHRVAYLTLFAEADGTATPPPEVPEGYPVPTPNETCPGWVHDQYTVTGPDGEVYHTWHPQIDPVYWCYFHHEHGSNPAHLGVDDWNPPFDYAAQRMGGTEAHPGFKGYAFSESGVEWYIMHHFGTGSIGRACRPMHTVQISAAIDGTLVAQVEFMGDHGAGRAFVDGLPVLTPDDCPNQGAIDSTGTRQLLVNGYPSAYEPWRIDSSRLIDAIGTGSLTFFTVDPITRCEDTQFCNEGVVWPGRTGTSRFIQMANQQDLRIRATGQASGVFYTDPMAREVVSADHPNAVQQYIQPGLDISASGIRNKCRDYFGWGKQMFCDVGNAPAENFGSITETANREDSIRRSN